MTASPLETRAVLGIDAAWTVSQPSGVALAVETEGGWRLDIEKLFAACLLFVTPKTSSSSGGNSISAPHQRSLIA